MQRSAKRVASKSSVAILIAPPINLRYAWVQGLHRLIRFYGRRDDRIVPMTALMSVTTT